MTAWNAISKDIANRTLLHESLIEAALQDAVRDCTFCAAWIAGTARGFHLFPYGIGRCMLA